MLFVVFDELLEVCRFVIEVDLRLSALLKSSLHAVFDPTCHLWLDFFDSPMKPRCEVLHFEETLIDKRFPFPYVNVLPNKRISNKLEHFTSRNGNIVPGDRLHVFCQRVPPDVIINLRSLVSFCFKVCCAGETLHRQCTLAWSVWTCAVAWRSYIFLLHFYLDSRAFSWAVCTFGSAGLSYLICNWFCTATIRGFFIIFDLR